MVPDRARDIALHRAKIVSGHLTAHALVEPNSGLVSNATSGSFLSHARSFLFDPAVEESAEYAGHPLWALEGPGPSWPSGPGRACAPKKLAFMMRMNKLLLANVVYQGKANNTHTQNMDNT